MKDQIMPEQSATGAETPNAFDLKLTRCLSMVMHHPEVQAIAEVVRRVHAGADAPESNIKKDQSGE